MILPVLLATLPANHFRLLIDLIAVIFFVTFLVTLNTFGFFAYLELYLVFLCIKVEGYS